MDGPILISELKKLLKYDGQGKKQQEALTRDKSDKIQHGLNLHN